MSWRTTREISARIAQLRDPARIWPLTHEERAELDRLDNALYHRRLRLVDTPKGKAA